MGLYFVGGVALLATVAAIGAVALWRAVRFDFSDDFLSDLDLSTLLKKEEFAQTGAMPLSSKLEGRFVRWCDPAFCFTGKDFWKTFQDDKRKWDAQNRYAGSGANVGHYFALNETGATAEAGFYKMDLSQRAIMTIEAAFDSILDLTYEDNLLAVAKVALSDINDVPERHFFVTMLSELLNDAPGGTPFTDYVGRWAASQGYDGILFFGARAIRAYPDLVHYIETGSDDGMAGPVVHDYFRDMRGRDDLKNLAILSGATLTSRVRRSWLAGAAVEENPYFGKSLSELDEILEYNSDYQREQFEKRIYLVRPFDVTK